jgi:hypothetical protein
MAALLSSGGSSPPTQVGIDPECGDASISGDYLASGLGPLPNGPGAAAVLAAGIGSLALGVFAFAGDALPAVRRAFNVWNPSGPLSGVTLTAVVVWLLAWFVLSRTWALRNVSLVRVNAAAFVMLLAGLLLTFPPLMDLLQGK